jgi:hypothetical protein
MLADVGAEDVRLKANGTALSARFLIVPSSRLRGRGSSTKESDRFAHPHPNLPPQAGEGGPKSSS